MSLVKCELVGLQFTPAQSDIFTRTDRVPMLMTIQVVRGNRYVLSSIGSIAHSAAQVHTI